jgi:hypothetical protein
MSMMALILALILVAVEADGLIDCPAASDEF